MDIPADYTTLDAVRRSILQANLTGNTGDDALLTQFIRGASAFISKRTARSFVPFRALRKFDFKKTRVLDVMPFDLLEVITLTNGDATVIDNTKFVMAPRNMYPKYRIELLSSSGLVFSYTSDWQEAIQILGIWGHHQNPSQMWIDTSESVPTGGISDSDRLMTVSDPNGLDDDGRKRFEVRQYLKIEDEVCQVTDIITTSNDPLPDTYQLRIARGMLGTTKVAHLEDTPIYRYAQEDALETLCLRLCIWLYQHRDVAEGAIQLLNGALVLEDKTLVQILNEIDNFEKPVVYAT